MAFPAAEVLEEAEATTALAIFEAFDAAQLQSFFPRYNSTCFQHQYCGKFALLTLSTRQCKGGAYEKNARKCRKLHLGC